MSYQFQVATGTDVGYRRELNEDAVGYTDNFFVVADGMGGHDAGEVASAITLNTLVDQRKAFQDNNGEHTQPGIRDLQLWLTEANKKVFEIADGNAGTTLTMLAVIEHEQRQRLAVANVGDSRTYRYRTTTDELTQLTQDHSAVAEMVRAGQLTEEQARQHPGRNIITRAVGSTPRLMADMVLMDSQVGDRFLLCTDGLTSEVDDDELAMILSSAENPEQACANLIERALELDGTDNITVLVADCLQSPS